MNEQVKCKHGIYNPVANCGFCADRNKHEPASPAGLPEMMRADAVTKLEMWKQNQALLQQLEFLKQSHAALVNLLEARLAQQNCTCKLNRYTGKKPPCQTCRDRAALADAQKVTG